MSHYSIEHYDDPFFGNPRFKTHAPPAIVGKPFATPDEIIADIQYGLDSAAQHKEEDIEWVLAKISWYTLRPGEHNDEIQRLCDAVMIALDPVVIGIELRLTARFLGDESDPTVKKVSTWAAGYLPNAEMWTQIAALLQSFDREEVLEMILSEADNLAENYELTLATADSEIANRSMEQR